MPVAEPPPIPESIARWWRDKTPEQVASIAAHDGRILWPEIAKKRVEGGRIKEIPCYIAVPTPMDRLQAVVATNAEIARLFKITDPHKLPLSRTAAVEMLGETEWVLLNVPHLVSFCLFEATPVEGRAERRPMFLPQTIVRELGMSSIWDLHKRLEQYEGMEDVRINEWSPEIMDAMVIACARCMSLDPLRECSGVLQERIMLEAMSELARLRASSESSESLSTSMPE